MTVIKSQDLNISIPRRRIVRTTVEKKEETVWIVTATLEADRPIVLGRYPTKEEAIMADTEMWLSEKDFYEFPLSSVVAPEERIDDRQSKRHGGS